MIKFWLNAICIYLCSNGVYAQIFEIQQGSDIYTATIKVNCEENICSGLGEVKLYDKANKKLVQTFMSEDLYFYLDENQQPSVNVIQLYDEQSPLIFDDFNFDGSLDLAIRNGNMGSYGGPTYDVYVYHKTKKKFVLSKELSDLTYLNLGMFDVDHERQRLVTMNKSGCCFHMTDEYQVIPKKGLVLVREYIEDATFAVGGDSVKVTERHLIHGKWQEKVNYYPMDEYYKD